MDASVIIPTFNRFDSLKTLLLSIEMQEVGHLAFEVVLVDDGSTDETARLGSQDFNIRLRYIRQSNQGSATARNHGAEQSRGRILCFLDDDMSLEPGYIRALVDLHDRHNRVVGMGTSIPYLSEEPSCYERSNAAEAHDRSGLRHRFVEFTACVTNNLSVEREAFYRIGGMSDVSGDGPAWWGDVDFGYRAWKKGYRFCQSSEAVCVHRDYSARDLTIACQRLEKASFMVHDLFARCPDVEKHLPMFEDKFPISWKQDSLRLISRKCLRQISSTQIFSKLLKSLTLQTEKFLPIPWLLRPLYRWNIGGHIYRGFRQGLRSQERKERG